MVKLSEILASVNRTLKENFPGIKIDSKDLSEQFDRPSFRTELDALKTEAFMTGYKKRNLVIRIYYFPKDKGKGRLEKLKIQDKLEEAFYLHLKVDRTAPLPAFLFPIDEISFEESDGVLITTFETYSYEEIEREDTTPEMENLGVNIK